MLSVIIVDDEKLAIKRLKRILLDSGAIGECSVFSNPREAYEFAKEQRIDVAFLDISMPEINGMRLSQLLAELDDSIDIVFVTGYDNYAVQAFDMSALDYILKPITAERVAKTLHKLKKRPRVKTSDAMLSVSLFNGLDIRIQFEENERAEPIKLRSPITEELFAYLVCHRTATREEVVEALWPDLHGEKALNNLNTNLYYIRRTLAGNKASPCFISGKKEIRVDDSGLQCDLYEFERLLDKIKDASEPSAELLQQAAALYKGDLLKGKAYEWAAEQSRRLERSYIELLEFAARHSLDSDQPHRALSYFQDILKLDPIREDVHHEVIRLYIEFGRHQEAERQYRSLEEILRRELGTSPDARMRKLMGRR